MIVSIPPIQWLEAWSITKTSHVLEMQIHKLILENTDILQLSQKYLAFEINVAKEIKILIAINFNVMCAIQ